MTGNVTATNALPTIIVRDPREKKHKCSVYPLRGREGFIFVTYPARHSLDLEGYVRLAPEGPELSTEDAESGLLLLDASWRWSRAMTQNYEDVPPRSLAGYQTAFPRTSRLGTDPENGLASIEALFIAYRILGRSTEGLLDHYHWAEEFLARNEWSPESESSKKE